jgi:hypothetical protein
VPALPAASGARTQIHAAMRITAEGSMRVCYKPLMAREIQSTAGATAE